MLNDKEQSPAVELSNKLGDAEEQSPAVEMPNTARCAEKQSSALTVQRGRLSVSSTILTRRAALKSNCPHSSRRGRVHERLA